MQGVPPIQFLKMTTRLSHLIYPQDDHIEVPNLTTAEKERMGCKYQCYDKDLILPRHEYTGKKDEAGRAIIEIYNRHCLQEAKFGFVPLWDRVVDTYERDGIAIHVKELVWYKPKYQCFLVNDILFNGYEQVPVPSILFGTGAPLKTQEEHERDEKEHMNHKHRSNYFHPMWHQYEESYQEWEKDNKDILFPEELAAISVQWEEERRRELQAQQEREEAEAQAEAQMALEAEQESWDDYFSRIKQEAKEIEDPFERLDRLEEVQQEEDAYMADQAHAWQHGLQDFDEQQVLRIQEWLFTQQEQGTRDRRSDCSITMGLQGDEDNRFSNFMDQIQVFTQDTSGEEDVDMVYQEHWQSEHGEGTEPMDARGLSINSYRHHRHSYDNEAERGHLEAADRRIEDGHL